MNQPRVSIIIPTYNRSLELQRTLGALADQSFEACHFEVLVVDDGSTEDMNPVIDIDYPFRLVYLRQENCGATVARNNGASRSNGNIIVFLDDDICLFPETLERLVYEMGQREQMIILGALELPKAICQQSVYSTVMCWENRQAVGEVLFTECMTGLLVVRRDDFFKLGGFYDPTGGWPNWDDVDFGYRAHRNKFSLVRLADAKAEHWDYAAIDLTKSCERWERASRSAARLLLNYPELTKHIPMFHDKVPINWSADSAKLVGRKLARSVMSNRSMLAIFKMMARFLERNYPKPRLLSSFYRWITGGYIYRGYRRGLRELSENPTHRQSLVPKTRE